MRSNGYMTRAPTIYLLTNKSIMLYSSMHKWHGHSCTDVLLRNYSLTPSPYHSEYIYSINKKKTGKNSRALNYTTAIVLSKIHTSRSSSTCFHQGS